MSTPTAKCEHCLFFKRDRDIEAVKVTVYWGVCRFDPPIATVEDSGFFPASADNWWCGKFRWAQEFTDLKTEIYRDSGMELALLAAQGDLENAQGVNNALRAEIKRQQESIRLLQEEAGN
jgi:hypothetical protein